MILEREEQESMHLSWHAVEENDEYYTKSYTYAQILLWEEPQIIQDIECLDDFIERFIFTY